MGTTMPKPPDGRPADRTAPCVLRFFASRRRHTRYWRDWSSDVCSSDLPAADPRRRADRPARHRPGLHLGVRGQRRHRARAVRRPDRAGPAALHLRQRDLDVGPADARVVPPRGRRRPAGLPRRPRLLRLARRDAGAGRLRDLPGRGAQLPGLALPQRAGRGRPGGRALRREPALPRLPLAARPAGRRADRCPRPRRPAAGPLHRPAARRPGAGAVRCGRVRAGAGVGLRPDRGDRPRPGAGQLTAVLRLDDVTVRYGGTTALAGVDLEVGPGERVAVVGASGAGKSTLLGVANGSVPPTTGTVRVLGADPAALSGRDRRRLWARVGTVHQSLELVGRLRVVHNVNAGRLADWSAARAAWSLVRPQGLDRKSTRLNSSHANISYAVLCLKKKYSPPSLLI